MISQKVLIQHIPDFLDYCHHENLSIKTQENYKRFLERFSRWITGSNLATLLPHQLTVNHVNRYKHYLSREPLKIITQNYYLIALRALLSYFQEKGIVSLVSFKITLPRANKDPKDLKHPNESQLKELLGAIKGENEISLRNIALLHTIVLTGLKIGQIIKLNRNSVNALPKEVLRHVKKYLDVRSDGEQALFINYSGIKSAPRRLSARMIQKLVKGWGYKIGLPDSITPETLRFARMVTQWNREVEIKSESWMATEENVSKKIRWLKENISTFPEQHRARTPLSSLVKCDECVLRKIAALMTAGLVTFEKIPLHNIWPGFSFASKNKTLSRQGKNWHRQMIDSVAQYFEKQYSKNNTLFEPVLSYGRADIAIENGPQKIYIEIGTVSLFKIWYNLMTMQNVTFLLVPDENHIIKINIPVAK